MKKKIIGISVSVTAILLSVIIFGLTSIAADNGDMLYGRTALGKQENGANMQAAYDKIVAGIENFESTINIFKTQVYVAKATETQAAKDEISDIMDAVFSDRPDLFWYGGSYEYTYSGEVVQNVLPVYNYAKSNTEFHTFTLDEKNKMKTELETEANRLTSDLSGKSDFDKALILHDRIAESTDYAWGANNQNAYGALVGKKAVCAGYSRAYQLLLKKVGIPAWYVVGVSYNPATGDPENHGWVLVKLDGDWYYTDLTWDDQDFHIFHVYFNVTSEMLFTDHAVKSGFYANNVPTCTATNLYYFNKLGTTVKDTACTKQYFAEIMGKNGGVFNCYITGNTNTVEYVYKNNISSIAEALGVQGGFSYSSTSLGNEVYYVISVMPGDVNGDSEINGADLIKLKNYLANYSLTSKTSSSSTFVSGADVNGDGLVNGKDLVRLKKYLVNPSSVTLGK